MDREVGRPRSLPAGKPALPPTRGCAPGARLARVDACPFQCRNPSLAAYTHAVSEVTRILDRVQQGDANAAEELLPLVYDELRRMAAAKMAHEGPGQTLQPTALVHEAWLRLSQQADARWQNREQFYAMAAEVMRRILVDRARRRQARKHGGQLERVDLDAVESAAPVDDEWLLQVHDALERLAAEDSRKAEIVKLKFYVGLNNAEVAALLGVSEKTIKRDWAFAKAWLARVIRKID